MKGKQAPATFGQPSVDELLDQGVPVVKSLLETVAQVCDNNYSCGCSMLVVQRETETISWYSALHGN
jgi:hypothetical protein